MQLLLIKCFIRTFAANPSKQAIPMFNNPEISPSIIVSAVNTRFISFLFDFIARNIPISFVLFNTEIYVIILIIILDTINEIDINAIKTIEIILTTFVKVWVKTFISLIKIILFSFEVLSSYLLMKLVISVFEVVFLG